MRENDYTETDVGKLFLKMRDRRKVRERTDDEDREAGTPASASRAQPPPVKRRKYKISRTNVDQKSRSETNDRNRMRKDCPASLDQTPDTDQHHDDNVKHKDEEMLDSNSRSRRCFPIFNFKTKQSKVGGGGEKTKTVRKVKVIPKNYNYKKITEHFKPQVVKTNVQNEPEPESKAKKGGESQLLVDVEKTTTVTRPPDVSYVQLGEST